MRACRPRVDADAARDRRSIVWELQGQLRVQLLAVLHMLAGNWEEEQEAGVVQGVQASRAVKLARVCWPAQLVDLLKGGGV